jgi:hypothetical protein
MNREQLGRPVAETSRAERPVAHMCQSKVELGQFVFLNVEIDADTPLHRGTQFKYRHPHLRLRLILSSFPGIMFSCGSPLHRQDSS